MVDVTATRKVLTAFAKTFPNKESGTALCLENTCFQSNTTRFQLFHGPLLPFPTPLIYNHSIAAVGNSARIAFTM
jgi:hypothetical protein